MQFTVLFVLISLVFLAISGQTEARIFFREKRENSLTRAIRHLRNDTHMGNPVGPGK